MALSDPGPPFYLLIDSVAVSGLAHCEVCLPSDKSSLRVFSAESKSALAAAGSGTSWANAKTSLQDGLAANPLPYFEQAFQYVQTLIVDTYKSQNCTYPELLEEVRKVDPDIVGRYFQFFNTVDCNIYGKWCSGTLTLEEYDTFCRAVDEWKVVTSRMIKMVERKPVWTTRVP